MAGAAFRGLDSGEDGWEPLDYGNDQVLIVVFLFFQVVPRSPEDVVSGSKRSCDGVRS